MSSFTVLRKPGIAVPSNGWTSAFHRIWKWRRHPWSTASSHLCLGSNISNVFSVIARLFLPRSVFVLWIRVYQNSSSIIPMNPVWKIHQMSCQNFSTALRISLVPCFVWNSRMVMSDTFLHHLQHPPCGPKNSNSRRSAFGALPKLQRSKRTLPSSWNHVMAWWFDL